MTATTVFEHAAIQRDPSDPQIYRLAGTPLIVAPIHSEEVLASMYLEMKRQGVLDLYFHDGPVPRLSWFLERFTTIPVLGGFVEQPGGAVFLCGLGTANDIQTTGDGRFKKSELSMVFLRDLPREADTVTLGKMMVTWAFNELGLSLAVGTTPAPNRAALMYLKKLGFISLGALPNFTTYKGELCGAVISFMTPELWEKQANKGEEHERPEN